MKHSYVARDPAQIPTIVAEAFYIAQTGRPGPVLIDIPKDVGLEEFDYRPVEPGTVHLPGYRPTIKGNPRQINHAIRLIRASERPLLYVGGRCYHRECSWRNSAPGRLFPDSRNHDPDG